MTRSGRTLSLSPRCAVGLLRYRWGLRHGQVCKGGLVGWEGRRAGPPAWYLCTCSLYLAPCLHSLTPRLTLTSPNKHAGARATSSQVPALVGCWPGPPWLVRRPMPLVCRLASAAPRSGGHRLLGRPSARRSRARHRLPSSWPECRSAAPRWSGSVRNKRSVPLAVVAARSRRACGRPSPAACACMSALPRASRMVM